MVVFSNLLPSSSFSGRTASMNWPFCMRTTGILIDRVSHVENLLLLRSSVTARRAVPTFHTLALKAERPKGPVSERERERKTQLGAEEAAAVATSWPPEGASQEDQPGPQRGPAETGG